MNAKKTIATLSIHGRGRDFEMNAKYGEIGYSRINPSMLRIFLGDDPKGVVVPNSNGFLISNTLRAKIYPDGDLIWSAEGAGMGDALDAIRGQIKRIHKLCLNSYQSLIPVGGGGLVNGSTQARKVEIKLPGGRLTTRVVPVSQVHKIGRQLFIPYWLAKEKTGYAQFPGPFRLPEKIEEEFAKITHEFESQVSNLIEAAKPFQEAERERFAILKAQRAVELARREEQSKLDLIKRQKAEAAALKQLERRRAAQKLRDESVEAFVGATVSWFLIEGSKKWPEYKFFTEQNCTVRFRGSFVYITLPNGREMMRKPQTVEVIHNGELMTDGSSLRKTREWANKKK